MILADKLIKLRKKSGMSQEELAEVMQVSRQAVSKWESAQTVPDLQKILALASLFGVTTDYLLKDDIEDEEYTDENFTPVKKVSLAMANGYLQWNKTAAARIAFGVFLCIFSVVQLIFLGAVAEYHLRNITEETAAVIGVSVLLVIVACAVALFVSCYFKNAPYAFLSKESFETEYGVSGMVRERQREYSETYKRNNIVGVCICILSPIPIITGAITENELFTVMMLIITLLLISVATVFFITSGVVWSGMQKLLKEGEYTLQEKRKSRIKEKIAAMYWLTATAIFLGWSVRTNSWGTTWIVWPVAGVLFGVVMVLCNLIIESKDRK